MGQDAGWWVAGGRRAQHLSCKPARMRQLGRGGRVPGGRGVQGCWEAALDDFVSVPSWLRPSCRPARTPRLTAPCATLSLPSRLTARPPLTRCPTATGPPCSSPGECPAAGAERARGALPPRAPAGPAPSGTSACAPHALCHPAPSSRLTVCLLPRRHEFVLVKRARSVPDAPPLDPARIRQFGLVLSRWVAGRLGGRAGHPAAATRSRACTELAAGALLPPPLPVSCRWPPAADAPANPTPTHQPTASPSTAMPTGPVHRSAGHPTVL